MKLFIKLICISLLFIFYSCSSEEPNEYQVTIEVKVSSDATVWIHGIGENNGQGVNFQRYMKRTFAAKSGYDQIIIRCDDSEALLSVKIWVNQKLVKDTIGNSYIDIRNYLS